MFLQFLCGFVSAQNETYEGLSALAAIVENILIYGRTKEEHEANVEEGREGQNSN